MTNILSLSKARKAKARSAKEATSVENRVKFGRTKAEKQREAAARADGTWVDEEEDAA